MNVLLMAVMVASTVALQVKIQNLIPLTNDIVANPNEENEEEHGSNTTMAQLQEQLQGVVSCYSTIDNYGWGIWADGVKKANSGRFTMPEDTNVLAAFQGDAENGCTTGGFRLKCTCGNNCKWNGFTTTSNTKWLVYSSNNKNAPDANWNKELFDDSHWPTATYSSRNTDANWKGICGKSGKNWWFRTQQMFPATTQPATTAAAVEVEGTRSAQSINMDFSKLVHEKFSQEAAHGTWNLQLNLDTDPCSVLTCKASSQCHAVGTCSKAAGGVCSDPFLAAGTPCNDEVQKTVNDVCDGKGGCAGVNIDLGCLEMHYDASKFAKDYRVQTWKDLAKKGHDATAYSTVPNVRVDQNNKNMPYVPIIPNRYFRVNGPSTFLKTIVSVFRRGDGGTTWNNYGATLARRSGRSHNWLFQSGNTKLHSNQFPQRAWKNGKELTQGNHFDMAPINNFFVLVIEVKGTGGKTSHYLGRGDAGVTRVDLQEVLGYDRILTDVERKNVEAYLSKKWNIKA